MEGDESDSYTKYEASALSGLDRDAVQKDLVASGMWTALRTRPYSKVPAIGSAPNSIFVSAMDTNPLAADPAVIIAERKADFENGLVVLSRLTDGALYVSKAPGADIPVGASNAQVMSLLAHTLPGWSVLTFTIWIQLVQLSRYGTSAIKTLLPSVRYSPLVSWTTAALLRLLVQLQKIHV